MGIYPEYYIAQPPGKAANIEIWETRTEEEKQFLRCAFINNPVLTTTTYLPVETRWSPIVRDMPMVQHYYPAYYYCVLYMLVNGETQGDQMIIDSNGLWHYVLGRIATTHATAHARKHLPRARSPPSTVNHEEFFERYYPTWDWEVVNNHMVWDVAEIHFGQWYHAYCKPMIKEGEDRFGNFFMAMEMILDYVTHLVDEKFACLMRDFNENRELHNTTARAILVLLCHRSSEYGRMRQRFFENDWHTIRYHIDHTEDS
jgi:hypothetical protein